jgi:uncharacterized repeat protein (TIGR03803 family)
MILRIKASFLLAGVLTISLASPCARGEVNLNTLASFNGTNGSDPSWGSLVQGSDGSFYGTTYAGGENTNYGPNGSFGYGTVFKVTPGGSLTSLASFNGTNGINPTASLVEAGDGTFYGTTWYGGSNNLGTVFQITTNGLLTTLVSFNGTNGASPRAALVLGNDGSLYSATRFGGTAGNGTVFKITTNGTLTTLCSFPPGGNVGNPIAPLTLGSDGNFYGQADGGTYGWGIVFKVTPDGTLTTLVSLDSTNGISNAAGLIQGSDGNFYAVSQAGGPQGAGGVFKVSLTGIQTTLVSFTNHALALGALVEGSDGNFYGTRNGSGAPDYGSVFQVTPAGTYTDLLVQFSATNGRDPRAALIQGKDGNFYGATQGGGAYYFGTVFRLNVPSSDSPRIRTVAKSANTMALTWGALPGRSYQVQFRTDLSQTNWNDLGSPVTATNTLATSSDSNASDSQRFYRVVLQP